MSMIASQILFNLFIFQIFSIEIFMLIIFFYKKHLFF